MARNRFPLRLLFVGFGNVGRELARILADRNAYPALADLDVSVVGLTTGSRGSLANAGGIDLRRALDEVEGHGRFTVQNPDYANLDSLKAAETLDYDVLVEMSPLSIANRGEPAISHARTALERGRHVISCNKGPLAYAFRRLREIADANHAGFLHETTVMDGAPVFDMARNCMRGNTILKIDGILNSTSNYVLCAMEKGRTFEEGVRGAQAEQIAEADPSNDLDGWDASVKIVALANVLMGADLRPEDVDRESMSAITPAKVSEAKERGFRIKMVCSAWREGGAVKASVRAAEVPLDHPFALVDATGSIVRFETDLLGKILMTEENPDITTTAYGVIADLYALDSGSR